MAKSKKDFDLYDAEIEDVDEIACYAVNDGKNVVCYRHREREL